MTNKSFASVLVIIALGFASCAKPDIKGCMDKDSTNYDAEATVDDGNCLYSGNIIIWWGDVFTRDIEDVGGSKVRIKIDGVFISYLPVSSQSFPAAPSCGTPGALTVPYDLGTSKSKSAVIIAELMDDQNNILGDKSFTLTVNANTCINLEIK